MTRNRQSRPGRQTGITPIQVSRYSWIGPKGHAVLATLVGPCGETSDAERPRTRADCIDGPRPCPWVGCPDHLGLDVTEFGALRITWPELQIGEILFSCSRDVVDMYPDGLGYDQIGAICNLTNERVAQIGRKAMDKLEGLMRGY